MFFQEVTQTAPISRMALASGELEGARADEGGDTLAAALEQRLPHFIARSNARQEEVCVCVCV